eukprot:COSAG06_NODE_6227_length_3032_cov_149.678145_2_plen_83_part_00
MIMNNDYNENTALYLPTLIIVLPSTKTIILFPRHREKIHHKTSTVFSQKWETANDPVSKNGLFEPFIYIYNERLTKTGSGQT